MWSFKTLRNGYTIIINKLVLVIFKACSKKNTLLFNSLRYNRCHIQITIMKTLIILSVLASALGQDYGLMNNMVDFDGAPYQSISLPLPYNDERERRIVNMRSKPIKNAIVFNNGFEEIKDTANANESGEVKTSLSNINTSLISTIGAVATKFLGGLIKALKLLILNIPALIIGAILVVGFCKITSVCTKLSSIQSLTEAQNELSAFITPERLDMATEFVQEAVRRLRSIQSN